ncbi:transporter [Flavobacterium sp. Fl-318]|uniref:Transporter n=1 Tax=Flavobacterium cupriresistens TaxID=2893885 RepID=A0ABU4RER2_9FLAO|nr:MULTISPECIES: transporter [unclassified Flavobacterium]MDX6191102.1 transporter [Flavobacterium sp. Fl-318]UFH42577.1 transporter [Flavobacterium sp. F-323]
MKRILLTIVLLVGLSAYSFTEKDSLSSFTFQRLAMLEDFDCDACGCSASGGSMGFSSMLNNNFVGVRYFKQSYTSRDGIFNNSPWIDENFNTVQAWARIPITQKIQISALVPYHFHERELTSGTESIAGLGDITVMGLYSVYETKKDSTLFTHKINLGAGVKMPTGKFAEANNLGSINQSFQLGTGSWDYLLVSEYVIKKNNLGLNTMLNYVFKTENSKNYQYGDQFNYASTLFYLFNLEAFQLVPQLGLAGEVYQTNKQHGLDLPDTAGDILFGKFGIEVGRDKFSLGINAMLPINQNLSSGKMEANYRWGINLNYTL